MKKKIRLIIGAVLALVLVIGIVMTVRQQLDYKKGRKDYDDALATAMSTPSSAPEDKPEKEESAPKQEQEQENEQEEAAKPRDPMLDKLEELSLENLQAVNSDVVGWITIPDTDVNYPILQTGDNRFYLNKTWKKQASTVGSIFMECQNRADLSQFNTLIYGHNMKDGSMFSVLRNYLEEGYWEEHPYVYVAVENDVRRYDIYAAYEVGVWEITYGLEIEKEEDKQEFIDFGLSKSKIDTGVVPTVEDDVLTLSTCTGNGNAATGTRWVIQAVWNKDA